MKKIMDLKLTSFLKGMLFKLRRRENSVIFVFFATVVVLFFFGWFFIFTSEKIKGLEKQIVVLEKKTKNLIVNAKKKEQFLEKYKKCDENFLKNSIESFVFLKEDQEVLSKIEDETYLPIKERLAFLKSSENQLKFVNRVSRKLYEYKENEWDLEHSVELNKKDLTHLLSSIEGNSPLKPQFIIKKIDLKCKREIPLFSLHLEILQRGPNDGV